ncbi:hypothetical protein PHLGIDRAFT_114266 [Phlebiopsis gigantea 11061_1 CR5-6]|uniref:BTB domain-containing protein n=1 Tax=Phlebiopsis gigantea (strain 11061_1 CR5-6) TaxID=745531 RepID=A0A0C3SDC1_PHLG1|nr:hypothetical protein PHLGIDRAFT_114266 [Phlebiopsis gigantea 11061_1 CR5-6]
MKLQKVESELTVQFQVDDLQTYFTRSSSSRYTAHFGPGLRFGSYSFVDAAGPSHIGLYLYTSKEYPAMSVNWTVVTRSLDGQTYQSRTMTYAFTSGEAIGWSKFLTSEAYNNNATMKTENTMLIYATLRFAPLWPIVFKPTLDVLHRTVCGRTPPDVQFVAYARRSSNGRLSGPRALFATKDAMSLRSNMFSDLYEGGITPLLASLLKDDERTKPTTFTTYRDDDSDFEDDSDAEAEDFDMVNSQLNPQDFDRAASSTGGEAVVVKSEPLSQASTSTFAAEDVPESTGNRVVLHGVAAATWEAILYWLYSGIIVFAPLTSGGRADRTAFIDQHTAANPDRPRPVSCKSIYRIADALRLDALKKRALDHLVGQLSTETYLHELFSAFTSRYDEVRKHEMLAVVKHWDELKGSKALQAKMQDVVSGKLPHAGQILADLLLRTSIKEESGGSK